jgi:nitroreductase
MDAEQTLQLLKTRRSVRRFQERPVPREALERVMQAAISAPSATNRQPWKFAVVTHPQRRDAIAAAVRTRIGEVRAFIEQSPHGAELKGYLDYFHGPLEGAPALVLGFYREHPDLLAYLVETGGGLPSRFVTMKQMQPELCGASAAVMSLLVQAHAEGLGGCWMTGPLLARDDIGQLVGIREPWRLFAAVALGYPAGADAPTRRKPLSEVVRWLDDAPSTS